MYNDSSWRYAVEDCCLSPGLHFPYNETTTWNRLGKGISLKVLDYRATSPWKCGYKFWILVGDMHFDLISRGAGYP